MRSLSLSLIFTCLWLTRFICFLKNMQFSPAVISLLAPHRGIDLRKMPHWDSKVTFHIHVIDRVPVSGRGDCSAQVVFGTSEAWNVCVIIVCDTPVSPFLEYDCLTVCASPQLWECSFPLRLFHACVPQAFNGFPAVSSCLRCWHVGCCDHFFLFPLDCFLSRSLQISFVVSLLHPPAKGSKNNNNIIS